MKRYGIWKITLLNVSGEVVICEITARSGKDARSRAEALYEGCQILKMTRIKWLNDLSYTAMADMLLAAYPNYCGSLLTILEDNGVSPVRRTSMRPIDADAFLKDILTARIGKTIIEYSESDIGYMIRKRPTIDAVPVVRCGECKYHEDEEIGMVYCPNMIGGWVAENWFCADGKTERRC